MRLCVIGAGYVGLVTAACFAEMGNQVRCVERDRERVARLRRGEMPIYEPGLESMLRDQLDAARLTFTASLAEGLADAEVVFIAVGTPCGEDGSADLSHVLAVAEQLGAQLRQACIVVNKSTVPVGTAERVEEIIRLGLARRRKRFRVAVASNPEFLKEGSAVDDFRRPDRVIIGSAETQAGETLRQLYAPFLRNHERVLLMGRREAEFSKYAANAFLTLSNPESTWRPGLFVSVQVAEATRKEVLTVADGAVQNVDGEDVVFVRVADGFVLQPVKLGISDGQRVEVLEGLRAGSQVAASGSFILKSELGKGSAEHGH